MSTWIYSLSLHDALPIWNASWLMCTSLISTVARGCQVRYINAVLLELEKRIQPCIETSPTRQERTRGPTTRPPPPWGGSGRERRVFQRYARRDAHAGVAVRGGDRVERRP